MAAADGVGRVLSALKQRVFFALWPDANVRDELAMAARRMHGVVHGRLARTDSIHLTLAFVGDVEADRIARLLAPPPGVAPSAFLLTLDDWGCWSRNGIGWAAPSRTPVPLRDLAANLESWLRGAGFDLEVRAFAPHVTLVRKAQCAPLVDSLAPIEWQVREFALIHSRIGAGGARYETLRAWPLG